MNSGVQRSVEIDFLRGVVLVIIAVDHIAGSTLARFTLHSYAFCDAAEVFVFLGGYASAAAFEAVDARRGTGAAIQRFLKRGWEIYRAYLITAVLMLLSGALMALLRTSTPMFEQTEWPAFVVRPVGMLFDIAMFRNQPYLAAVLPMYVIFAIGAALAMPLARRAPVKTLCASLLIWLIAPRLAEALPTVYPGGWSFNPFAWQLLFAAGILCRLHPLPERFHHGTAAAWITRVALAVALVFAFSKLVLETQPPPGYMKQDLASIRIVSFAAIAWLVACAVRAGWIACIARRAAVVVRIGRQGMPCFIVGAVTSLAVDTMLRAGAPGGGPKQWSIVAGLAGDLFTIATLIVTAILAQHWKSRGGKPAAARVSRSGRPAAMPACSTESGRHY